RQLPRDVGVLIDSIRNLLRAVDKTLFGETIDRELSVIRPVHPRYHPRRQVVLSAGRKRRHEDELGIFLTRQAHDYMPHERTLGRRLSKSARDLPLAFAVVERIGLRH